MNTNKGLEIFKKIGLSVIFPLLMFVVMLIITGTNEKCYVNGKLIFLSGDMVQQVFLNASMTICVALAIWIQLKNGQTIRVMGLAGTIAKVNTDVGNKVFSGSVLFIGIADLILQRLLVGVLGQGAEKGLGAGGRGGVGGHGLQENGKRQRKKLLDGLRRDPCLLGEGIDRRGGGHSF